MSRSNYNIIRNTWGGHYVQSPIAFNMGQEIVPRYPSMGYASLTHGGAGTGLGYYQVHGAYPDYGKSCTRFGRRLCGGLVEGSTTFHPNNPPNLRSAMGVRDSGSAYQMLYRGNDVTQTPPGVKEKVTFPGGSALSNYRAHAGQYADALKPPIVKPDPSKDPTQKNAPGSLILSNNDSIH